MYNKEIVTLILAVLTLIASIIAFLFPEASKHRGLRITIGIVLLFVAIILGTWGVSVLVLGDMLAKNTPAIASTDTPISPTVTFTSSSITPMIADTPLTETEPTDISTPTPVINTPTNIPIPPSPTSIPKPSTPIPTFTVEPVVLPVSVPGNSENGLRFDIQISGFYQLRYIGNSYSPWPAGSTDGDRGWATHVQVFINRPVEWGVTPFGLIGPINFDAYLGAPDYYEAENAAVAATQGKSISLGRLNAGDQVTFVVVDEQGTYSDNRGQVDLSLVLIGQ